MSRTVKLEDIGIHYEETGTQRVYVHLIAEPNGQFGFYVTVAENELEAIMSAAMNGKVIHTTTLLRTLSALATPMIDVDPQKG